jgi:rhodanese-related sulfurtransferase
MDTHLARDLLVRRGFLALLLVAMAATAAGSALADEPAEISADTLAARLEEGSPGPVVLDVRRRDEYLAGHVPGAINIPVDELTERIGELAALSDSDLVVYCLAGRRAERALTILTAHGFHRLMHLTGDMAGWRDSGHSISRSDGA